MTDRAGLLMNPGAKVKLNGAQIGTVAAVNETSDGSAELRVGHRPGPAGASCPTTCASRSAPQPCSAPSRSSSLHPTDPSTTPLRAGQVARLPARHRRGEHDLRATQLRSVTHRSGEAQRDAGCRVHGIQWSGRGVRALADRLQRLPGQDRTQPAAAEQRPAAPCPTSRPRTPMPHPTSWASCATPPRSVAPWSTKSPISTGSWSRASAWPTSATTSSAATASALANLMHLLVPTTDLTNEYHEALNCALKGVLLFALKPPGPNSRSHRSRRPHPWDRALPLPAGPAEGRRDRAAHSARASCRFSSTTSRPRSSRTSGPIPTATATSGCC